MRLLLLSCVAFGQTDFRTEIPEIYASTLSAMRTAETKGDIERLVDEMDAPEWLGALPTGATLTRADAISSLQGLLRVPAKDRPAPKQQMLYLAENGWRVVAVYWIYAVVKDRPVGSMARDTWVRTSRGWRRLRHEKLFPERPLDETALPSVRNP